ncbi:DNA starvation/stationary phase protection protein [Winogradskyella echinorum]|uniref:DNA starvation/stationary phase protection protein n=1 Tax=Winogradskyella echinorum TaxID=538189 RepID=A0ABR6Y0I9_9FLAO|nr:DNA starvation/stationary phase protection protein [Winogradskyella echinorum]MBC3846264.1 DNA starvation/stationary phase protection protein [Winogradskyella echinorum]MBC5750612.1 DNA starvation/stationary phase protection protein [Winogradskyella echinorum]
MSYLNIRDEKSLSTVVELNTLLANYHIYYQNLRNFHWNVLGENFFDLHNKFEELYTDARLKIDEIAERILTLRYHPMSHLKDYLNTASIKEAASKLTDKEMVKVILDNHSVLLKQMSVVIENAEKSKDEGTIDLIGAYIRELEKSSWMLDAFSKETTSQLNVSVM